MYSNKIQNVFHMINGRWYDVVIKWQIDVFGLMWPMVLAMVTVHPLPHHMGKWQGKEIFSTKAMGNDFESNPFPAQRQKCFEDKLNFTSSQTSQESDLSFINFPSFTSLIQIVFYFRFLVLVFLANCIQNMLASCPLVRNSSRYANLYESVVLVHIRQEYSYIMNMTLRLPNWPYWVCTIQTDVNQPTATRLLLSRNTFGSAETSFYYLFSFQTCVCIWKNGKETVECINRDLGDIPDGVEPSTQVGTQCQIFSFTLTLLNF